jgi:signal transduction protein with GAF and PtsI domain
MSAIDKLKKEAESRITDFGELMSEIESLDDKRRRLYIEIYENAVVDRQYGHSLFVELSQIVKGKSAEYAVHAKSLATFLERMSKANDQLLRLVELIAKADNKNTEVSSDDVFDKINA